MERPGAPRPFLLTRRSFSSSICCLSLSALLGVAPEPPRAVKRHRSAHPPQAVLAGKRPVKVLGCRVSNLLGAENASRARDPGHPAGHIDRIPVVIAGS